MRNYGGMCKGICSYNLVYKFLIQILPLKSSAFVVYFSNAFWHGNEAFPEISSQNEIVPLLVIFHLPYSKYRYVKICFYEFVSLSKSKFFTRVVRVALVWHSCRSCLTRVTLVLLVLHSCRSCRTRVARVWHSCCKLDQIRKKINY